MSKKMWRLPSSDVADACEIRLKYVHCGGIVEGKTSVAGASYILESENSRKAWFPLYNGAAHSFKHSKLNENTEYRYSVVGSITGITSLMFSKCSGGAMFMASRSIFFFVWSGEPGPHFKAASSFK